MHFTSPDFATECQGLSTACSTTDEAFIAIKMRCNQVPKSFIEGLLSCASLCTNFLSPVLATSRVKERSKQLLLH